MSLPPDALEPSPERTAFDAARAEAKADPPYSLLPTNPTPPDPLPDTGPTRLEPEYELPGCMFVMTLTGAVFWNGFVWGPVIAKRVSRLATPAAAPGPRPELDSSTVACMSVSLLIWAVFAAVGVVLFVTAVGYGVRWAVLRKTGRPAVEVSVRRFLPGTAFRITVGRLPRWSLRRVRLRLIRRERVTVKGGDGDTTETDETVVSVLFHGADLPAAADGVIPADAVPTFSVSDSEEGSADLTWFVNLRGRIFGGFPYSVNYPITVHAGDA